MKLRNEKQNSGHLLTFVFRKDKKDNFSFFFPVAGLSQFDTLLEISYGFEACIKPYENQYQYTGYSISDFGDIDNTFPEIDPHRILIFEQSEFLSDKSEFIEGIGDALIARCLVNPQQIFPTIVAGALASGSNFYGRDEDVGKLHGILSDGKSFLLRAPRRYGKTSLLKHITKHFSPSMDLCFVDLEGGDSSEDFVELILKGTLQNKAFCKILPGDIAESVQNTDSDIDRLKILRQERKAVNKDWKAYAETIFQSISTQKQNPSVIILDEVTFLVEDMLARKNNDKKEVEELFDWFSKMRMKFPDIQFILSGSEHLPSFLSAFGIDGQLSDFQETSLRLFSTKIANAFIFLILSGQKIVATQNEINCVLELMGKPIPYFLQIFLDALIKKCREEKQIEIEQIKTVYYNDLLGSGSKRYFESIKKQLEQYKRYGLRCRSGAETILDKLTVKESVSAEELKIIWDKTTDSSDQFATMMEIMKDDFYVKPIPENRFILDSKLIKDWWERHGLSGSR